MNLKNILKRNLKVIRHLKNVSDDCEVLYKIKILKDAGEKIRNFRNSEQNWKTKIYFFYLKRNHTLS